MRAQAPAASRVVRPVALVCSAALLFTCFTIFAGFTSGRTDRSLADAASVHGSAVTSVLGDDLPPAVVPPAVVVLILVVWSVVVATDAVIRSSPRRTMPRDRAPPIVHPSLGVRRTPNRRPLRSQVCSPH